MVVEHPARDRNAEGEPANHSQREDRLPARVEVSAWRLCPKGRAPQL